MEKIIDYEGYTKADKIQLQGDGSVICRLSNEDGKETVLGFPAGEFPFELTESDIELLMPKVSLQAEPLI